MAERERDFFVEYKSTSTSTLRVQRNFFSIKEVKRDEKFGCVKGKAVGHLELCVFLWCLYGFLRQSNSF